MIQIKEKTMVGVKGLEPSAPWSQTKYSNHTELRPDLHLIKPK